MSNAKRLTPSYDNNMCDDANGDYVSYSEYVKLTEQNKLLREALEEIVNLQTYDPDDSHYMANKASRALEATK